LTYRTSCSLILGDSDDRVPDNVSHSGLHDNVAEASESSGLRAMPVGQAKARLMPERLQIANGG
jgi:hypothetical protein